MRISDDWRVIVGCILGGFAGGVAVATTWKAESHKDFWDVLTALATTGAVFVALGIALIEGWRRRREELMRAKLVAASLALPLVVDVSRLGRILEWLTQAQQIDPTPEDYLQHVEELEAIDPQVSRDELTDIAVLPNDCARNIASATAQLRLVKAQMRAIQGLYGHDGTEAQRREMLGAMHGMLAAVKAKLFAAVLTCQRADYELDMPHRN